MKLLCPINARFIRCFCLILTLCLLLWGLNLPQANAYEQTEEYPLPFIGYTGPEDKMNGTLYYDSEGQVTASMEEIVYNYTATDSGRWYPTTNACWYDYDNKGNLIKEKCIFTGAQCPLRERTYQYVYQYDGRILTCHSTDIGGLSDVSARYSFQYNSLGQITKVNKYATIVWDVGGETEVVQTILDLSYSPDGKTVTLEGSIVGEQDSGYTVTYDLSCFPIVISCEDGGYAVSYSPSWNQSIGLLYVSADYTVTTDPEERKITFVNSKDAEDVYTYLYG